MLKLRREMISKENFGLYISELLNYKMYRVISEIVPNGVLIETIQQKKLMGNSILSHKIRLLDSMKLIFIFEPLKTIFPSNQLIQLHTQMFNIVESYRDFFNES